MSKKIKHVSAEEKSSPGRDSHANPSPSKSNGRAISDIKPKVNLNPLAPYKGVGRRFFQLYKHVIGLMVGGLLTRVDNLPAYKKKYFRSAGSRIPAFLLRPFVDGEIRTKPFPVQLRLRLERLGPTYIKLGQIMAIREDILPPEVTGELQFLLDRLPEVPFETIRHIVESSLRLESIYDNFVTINEKAIGSASIGQTHLATTRTGEKVVLKIIKPGIRDTILSDIKLLQILAIFLEWVIPRYQPGVIINEFCVYTEKEIDLTFEADHAELFAANFANETNIRFPKIYRELSARDVLCMEYFDGIKPNDGAVFNLPQEQQDQIVELGAWAIIKMLYQDGFFHADLHAGNLIILPGPQVGFIDLGMVGRFDERIRKNMLYYFYTLVNGDIESSTKYLLSMAKVGKGGDTLGFKRSVADLFRRFRLQSAHGNFSLGQLILESLAIGGRYRIFFPVEMTLMVKALVTFEGVGQTLRPNLNVPEISRKYVQRVYAEQYNPRHLVEQLMRGAPELIDVMVRFPELISSSARLVERIAKEDHQENPLVGIKSSLMAGACIVGGVVAVVQNGPPLLWIGLFVSSVLFFLFGK